MLMMSSFDITRYLGIVAVKIIANIGIIGVLVDI